MGTEDRHEEDLFPPDPSREGVSPGSEEPEEDFFVLEEEEEGQGEPSGEESGRKEEETLQARPAPEGEPEEDSSSAEEPGPEDFLEGEVDESLFEETPGSGDPGTPAGGEAFVPEPPGSGGETLSADGEEETGPEPGESGLEEELFGDLDGADSSGEDFGVDLPRFQEEGGGEPDLLEALEDFDPEEVHDAPRAPEGSEELEELGLDLDLDGDLELVDEVEDLVSPSQGEKEAPGAPEDEDALELVLEEDSYTPEQLVEPEGTGETEMVLQEEEEESIDESLFEEVESPDGPAGEESPAEASVEEPGTGEEELSGETREGGSPEFLAGDAAEEETPPSPLLSSFEEEEGVPGGEESKGEGGGVAPWMLPEEVLEETPEGMAASPTEETLLGAGGEEEDLPEIGLRPLEEEEPYPDGEEELSSESGREEPPTFEELYGLPESTGEGSGGGGEVESSDSVIVEAPKVVGSIYQEEEHGWGVKLILWGSLAASLAAGAFVGWAYMRQKASLSAPGRVFTARVEMPKPALPDHAPPPDLRPREETAWKPFQGAVEIPPPQEGPSQVAGKGGGKEAPPAGQEGGEKLAGGPGEKPAPPVKPLQDRPVFPPPPVKPARPEPPGLKAGKTGPSGEGERLAQGKPGKGAPGSGKEPAAAGEPTPVKPQPGPLAQAGPGEETPVPVEPSGPARPAGPETNPPAAPPASSGAAPEPKGWKDALGLVRGTQVLAELKNGNYFIGRIYKIGGRKVVLDVKKGQLTFYYDEVAHLMPIGPALARKLKEHPSGFVILKNTNRLKGEIVVEAKDYVTIQVREARITIPRESIERVEKGKETSLKLKDDPILAKELGMDDLPMEEEKPKPRAAPLHPSQPSIPSGAVEELDRLLGAARPKGNKDQEGKGLSLPAPREGKIKVRGDG